MTDPQGPVAAAAQEDAELIWARQLHVTVPPRSQPPKLDPPPLKLIFVDPDDDNALWWWPALVVPVHYLEAFRSAMADATIPEPQPGEYLVAYFEDGSYSIVPDADALPFCPYQPPYTTYASSPLGGARFCQDKAVVLATTYWEKHVLPPSFVWLKQENQERVQHLLSLQHESNAPTLTPLDVIPNNQAVKQPIEVPLASIEPSLHSQELELEGTGIYGYQRKRVSIPPPKLDGFVDSLFIDKHPMKPASRKSFKSIDKSTRLVQRKKSRDESEPGYSSSSSPPPDSTSTCKKKKMSKSPCLVSQLPRQPPPILDIESTTFLKHLVPFNRKKAFIQRFHHAY